MAIDRFSCRELSERSVSAHEDVISLLRKGKGEGVRDRERRGARHVALCECRAVSVQDEHTQTERSKQLTVGGSQFSFVQHIRDCQGRRQS